MVHYFATRVYVLVYFHMFLDHILVHQIFGSDYRFTPAFYQGNSKDKPESHQKKNRNEIVDFLLFHTVDGRKFASDFTLDFSKGTLRYLQGTFKVPVGYLKTTAKAIVLGQARSTLKVPCRYLKVPLLKSYVKSLANFLPSTVAKKK